MADEPLHVAVYYRDDDEHDAAVSAMHESLPVGVEEFSGVVQGWVTPAELEKLVEHGLSVQLADPRTVHDTSLLELVAAPALMEELKRSTLNATFEADGGLAVTEHQAEYDPRIHAYGEYDAAPDAHAGLEADVYFLRLVAPITEEQRLELFHQHGVDIGAFLPPDRYRTFLDGKQHAVVRRLPYVRDVVRYRFEDTIAPELVALLADAEAKGSSRTFDCVLHRERDLAAVRQTIESTGGADVVGASNLRIRFQAPVDVALLSALASLPAVRKLSPYEAPPV
jgi:hypothetical protein